MRRFVLREIVLWLTYGLFSFLFLIIVFLVCNGFWNFTLLTMGLSCFILSKEIINLSDL